MAPSLALPRQPGVSLGLGMPCWLQSPIKPWLCVQVLGQEIRGRPEVCGGWRRVSRTDRCQCVDQNRAIYIYIYVGPNPTLPLSIRLQPQSMYMPSHHDCSLPWPVWPSALTPWDTNRNHVRRRAIRCTREMADCVCWAEV